MKALIQTRRWVPALVLLAFSTLVAAPASSDQQTSYRVIVHPDNPADSLTKSEVSQFLLKKKVRWRHGVPVEPVTIDKASVVSAAFSKDVHGRSVSSIKNYWQRQIAVGKEPPPEFASDAEVVDYVKGRPGAIGYVSSGATLDGVKVLDLAN